MAVREDGVAVYVLPFGLAYVHSNSIVSHPVTEISPASDPIVATPDSISVGASVASSDSWDISSSPHGAFVHCGNGIESDGGSVVISDPDVLQATAMTESLIRCVG